MGYWPKHMKVRRHNARMTLLLAHVALAGFRLEKTIPTYDGRHSAWSVRWPNGRHTEWFSSKYSAARFCMSYESYGEWLP